MIVDNEIGIRNAHWWVLEAAQRADREERFPPKRRWRSWWGPRQADGWSTSSMQVHGSIGVTTDLPLAVLVPASCASDASARGRARFSV
nr:hypothetical protein [Microbacterium liquefaciens]